MFFLCEQALALSPAMTAVFSGCIFRSGLEKYNVTELRVPTLWKQSDGPQQKQLEQMGIPLPSTTTQRMNTYPKTTGH